MGGRAVGVSVGRLRVEGGRDGWVGGRGAERVARADRAMSQGGVES